MVVGELCEYIVLRFEYNGGTKVPSIPQNSTCRFPKSSFCLHTALLANASSSQNSLLFLGDWDPPSLLTQGGIHIMSCRSSSAWHHGIMKISRNRVLLPAIGAFLLLAATLFTIGLYGLPGTEDRSVSFCEATSDWARNIRLSLHPETSTITRIPVHDLNIEQNVFALDKGEQDWPVISYELSSPTYGIQVRVYIFGDGLSIAEYMYGIYEGLHVGETTLAEIENLISPLVIRKSLVTREDNLNREVQRAFYVEGGFSGSSHITVSRFCIRSSRASGPNIPVTVSKGGASFSIENLRNLRNAPNPPTLEVEGFFELEGQLLEVARNLAEVGGAL